MEIGLYLIISERIKSQIHECTIGNDIHGSDHCPIVAQLKLPNKIYRKEETSPCLSTDELKESESESSENSSSEDTERESARLLPIQTRQSKKTEETRTKTLPKSFGRPKTRPSMIPQIAKDSTSKPSVSGTQQTTSTRTRVNLRQLTSLTRTTHTLNENKNRKEFTT